jgi:hypothetical protein
VDHFLEAIKRWIESKKGESSTQSQTTIVAKL